MYPFFFFSLPGCFVFHYLSTYFLKCLLLFHLTSFFDDVYLAVYVWPYFLVRLQLCPPLFLSLLQLTAREPESQQVERAAQVLATAQARPRES